MTLQVKISQNLSRTHVQHISLLPETKTICHFELCSGPHLIHKCLLSLKSHVRIHMPFLLSYILTKKVFDRIIWGKKQRTTMTNNWSPFSRLNILKFVVSFFQVRELCEAKPRIPASECKVKRQKTIVTIVWEICDFLSCWELIRTLMPLN